MARGNPVGSPFGEHELHNGLAPSGCGNRSGIVVGVAAAADQRRIAQTARGLIERAARGSSRGYAAFAVQRNRADGIVRNGGSKQILLLPRPLSLVFA